MRRSARSLRAKTGSLLPSFDHLVSSRLQGRRKGETKHFGGLKIYHELEFGWLLNWQLGWLFASEDLIDIRCRLAELIYKIGTVRHETAGIDKISEWMDGGQPQAHFEMGNLFEMKPQKRIRQSN